MSRRRIIYSFLIAPLDPAYKAGLAGAPPVDGSNYENKKRNNTSMVDSRNVVMIKTFVKAERTAWD